MTFVLGALILRFSVREWLWVGGSSTTEQPGHYGKLGVASSASYPGARCCAHVWSDRHGASWVFGGYGLANTSTPGYLNDLWRFNTSTRTWAWMGGSQTLNDPGVVSVGAGAQWPSARNYAAYAYDSYRHQLLLFSGEGVVSPSPSGKVSGGPVMNDMWSLTLPTNAAALPVWQRLSSYSPDVGSQATELRSLSKSPCGRDTADALPPPRKWANAWSIANASDFSFWLSSGVAPNSSPASTCARRDDRIFGCDGGNNALMLNDMWVWRWHSNVSGSVMGTGARDGLAGEAGGKWSRLYDRGADPVGVYNGTQQRPGARQNAFVGAVGTDLWMFGGQGFGSTSDKGTLSDMWRFDTAAQRWHFEGGVPGGTDIDGKCVTRRGNASCDNLPTARHAGTSFSARGGDGSGALYVFAGEHANEQDVFNDVWSVRMSREPNSAVECQLTWAWEAGAANVPNVGGVWDGSGIPSTRATPASRYASSGWVDTSGQLWVFGGYGIDQFGTAGYLNDLWMLELDH